MAKRKSSGTTGRIRTADYRHTREKRTNIPSAKIAAEGAVPKIPKAVYDYSPHLPPVLRSDPTGSTDRLPDLVAQAGRRPLKVEEQRVLAEALRQHDPWLEWATKREQHQKGFFEVDPVALHIHERVSTQAVVRAALREDVQSDLFADPQLPYQQAVQFYRHDMDWTNRLILGDSLQVMSSLARRENLAGKVQVIYIDPPYGIKFASNFQPALGNRDVKERDSDLTREPEMVRAYRDTWSLGVHSYLTYLRDRLAVAHELLTDTGSVFVQIGDENIHTVRCLLDEVFGRQNFVTALVVKKTAGLSKGQMPEVVDFILWYARDREQVRRTTLYVSKDFKDDEAYRLIEGKNGAHIAVELGDRDGDEIRDRVLRYQILLAAGRTPSCVYTVKEFGQSFDPTAGRSWSTNSEGMQRLIKAGRVVRSGSSLAYVRFWRDNPVNPLQNLWSDTASGSGMEKVYVVQTSTKVVERCILMTSEPGDLVLDPTCGSGTTAFVAEQWGRRWITIDTSRVALSIARQRLLTGRFEYYKLKDEAQGVRGGFVHKAVPHVQLQHIAQNVNLDPIFAKHAPILDDLLTAANVALMLVTNDLRDRLGSKLAAKERGEGKRAVVDTDRRRWILPRKGGKWEHWEVPFDADPDWPKALQDAVRAYRQAWLAKMADVNTCIAANTEYEELADQPEGLKRVLRVSGPFTVEGVRPAELGLEEEGMFGGVSGLETEDGGRAVERQNINAYLTKMIQHLRTDGVTFIGNKRRKFARVEPLFETATGSIVHAEGLWDGEDTSGPNAVAIGFGPQYGPVTAEQVEDLVRASKRYDELVISGFSFDAAASAAIQEALHPKLRIHQAYIRPDINPGMEGLLKDTGQSQLFTVFGQPEIKVQQAGAGQFIVKLDGVDVYDPIENAVRSTGADKVAAWFVDSDYDGRCFCITQAFFPRQDAWEKIAKALARNGDAEAFAAFSGTTSLPFRVGKHRRIAVKVIDPRGNEVMTVRALKA